MIDQRQPLTDRRFAVLSILLAGSFFLGSGGASARLVDRIVAVVNNEVILLSEVDVLCKYTLDQVPATLPLDEAVEKKRQIRLETLEGLIDDRLMEQKIRENRIEVTDEEIDTWLKKVRTDNNLTEEQFVVALRQEGKTLEEYKKMLRKTFTRQKLLGREIQSKIRVSEKDVEQYYKEHYLTGAGAEKVKASHILFSIPPGTKAELAKAVKERAEKVLADLKAGADFAETAKKVSDDPSASLGGDLGWFRRGDMVASFEEAAFRLDQGAMSGLVQTRFGYHIILVTDQATDEPPSRDEVSAEIRKRLGKQLETRHIRAWLEDLRRRSYIEIKL